MNEKVRRGWTISRQVRGSKRYPRSMVKYLYRVPGVVVSFV